MLRRRTSIVAALGTLLLGSLTTLRATAHYQPDGAGTDLRPTEQISLFFRQAWPSKYTGSIP
jgi:hypothetical protein